MEKVTLTTIAEATGVSRTTVSNAFNRPDQLSAVLRERILATAERLGYAGPDPRGRVLRRGRAGAIGFVFDEPLSYLFDDPAGVLLLRGVAEACQERSVALVLIYRMAEWGRAEDVVRTALVDGFVAFCDAIDDSRRRLIEERRLPVVALDAPVIAGEGFVGIDDRGAARAEVEHLLALGHERFGVVTLEITHDRRDARAVPDGLAVTTPYMVTRERLAGYREALESAGIDWQAVPVQYGGGTNASAGQRAALALLDARVQPTAILAMSDLVAGGVLAAAGQRGLRVPDDLSVVGFDDITEAAGFYPPLTTIRQPHAEKGAAAARLLLDGDSAGKQIVFPTELVVRASTGPPPR